MFKGEKRRKHYLGAENFPVRSYASRWTGSLRTW